MFGGLELFFDWCYTYNIFTINLMQKAIIVG